MNKRKIIISTVIGSLLILLLIGGYTAKKFIAKPQAPTLSLAVASKDATQYSPTLPAKIVPSPTNLKTVETKPVIESETPAIPTAIPIQVHPVCGQTGTWTILVLARAIHTEFAGPQSIRLVKVDFDLKNVLMYTLPPELALETPGLTTEYNIKYSNLDQIYSRIVERVGESKDANFKATQALAQVVFDSFGIPVEHYITIDNRIVIEAVDAVGGIYVLLSEDYTIPEDPKYGGLVLKAGRQQLNGDMLHAYISVSGAFGDDFGRLSRQNTVLEGIRKKLLNPTTYFRIRELYSIYQDHVVTDLSLEQMGSLGCIARLIPQDQIVMKEPQIDEILYWDDGSMHFKDLASIAKQLQTLFGVPGP